MVKKNPTTQIGHKSMDMNLLPKFTISIVQKILKDIGEISIKLLRRISLSLYKAGNFHYKN